MTSSYIMLTSEKLLLASVKVYILNSLKKKKDTGMKENGLLLSVSVLHHTLTTQ